jgi:hypothetical protein
LASTRWRRRRRRRRRWRRRAARGGAGADARIRRGRAPESDLSLADTSGAGLSATRRGEGASGVVRAWRARLRPRTRAAGWEVCGAPRSPRPAAGIRAATLPRSWEPLALALTQGRALPPAF